MKIAVLVDELISGGFQKVAIMEAVHLSRMGEEVSLVVLHKIENEGYQDLIKENNINVIHLSDRLPFYLKINFRFPFFAFFSFFHIFYPLFIGWYIKKKEFDIFITHGTYTAFSSISIVAIRTIPYVCFVHDSVGYIIKQKYSDKFPAFIIKVLSFIADKLDGLIIKKACAVCAFPDMIREMKKVSPFYSRYYEIYNGCDVLPPEGIIYSKENYAIAVTKWDQGKNFSFLVDLWKTLVNKIPLKIIGNFVPLELKNKFISMVNDAGLGSTIKFVGPVSESELREYYKKAKFLIHPCREAFGMTILESSACGCVSIFTNNSGVAGLYTRDIIQLLPAENSQDGYLNEINRYVSLSESELRKEIDKFRKVAENNSWENHCKKIMEIIVNK